MKATGNPAYDERVVQLSAWLHENELQRRVWAEERWSHPEGRWFKILRVAAPALSLYTIVSLIIYCLIRDTQMMMEDMLAYQPDTKYVELYMGAMLLMCAVLLAANILLFLKKYVAGGIMGGAAVLVVIAHIATQLNITMPTTQYRTFYTVNLVIYAGLLVCFAAILGILWYDRYDRKRMLQNTLSHLAVKNGRQTELLTLDDYVALIDEFLEAERHKLQSEQHLKIREKKARRKAGH